MVAPRFEARRILSLQRVNWITKHPPMFSRQEQFLTK